MDVSIEWRFCAVGNIKLQHIDDTGNILHGTKVFSGGTKVYIDDRTWELNKGYISVIGLSRFGRYTIQSIPVRLIENVRIKRIYKPTILNIMKGEELIDGWIWRGRTANDRRELQSFIEMWNNSNITQKPTP